MVTILQKDVIDLCLPLGFLFSEILILTFNSLSSFMLALVGGLALTSIWLNQV
jgi:hypothetical protein